MNYLTRCMSIFCKKRIFQKCLLRGGNATTSSNLTREAFKKIHNGRGSSVLLTRLGSRGLVRLQGNDTADFLQGLVTNDVHDLMRNYSSVQYSFMLNVQGRVLYDLFLFNMTGKDGSPSTVFVDVPGSAIEEFMGLLKRYKLRRKVDISNVTDEFQVWSQFSNQKEETADFSSESSPPQTMVYCADPRMANFGRRLIRTANVEEADAVDESVYKESRYKMGLPEGMEDLPPGNCFPLESNGAFMGAVSFTKGCYIGQELTARTHHTGVTRKRLMPLVFDGTPPDIETDATIKSEKGRNAGKLRGYEGSHGLGLVRLSYVKETLTITASDNSQVSLTTHLPHWWPELTDS